MEYHLEKMLKEIKNNEATLYDVREEEEWEEGHLDLAKHFPISNMYEDDFPGGLDKEKKIYLHCRSGKRVLEAKKILNEKGFENVIPLDEGFLTLLDEGLKEA